MANTVADFLAFLRQELTLPVSGLVVEVGRVDQLALIGLGELVIPVAPPPPPSTPSATTADLPVEAASPPPDPAPPAISARDFWRYKQGLVVAGVRNPPMSDARNDQGEPIYSKQSYLHVSDLDSQDFNFLFDHISKVMGLTPGDATDVIAFREESQRQDDPRVSGTLSDAPKRDPEVQSERDAAEHTHYVA